MVTIADGKLIAQEIKEDLYAYTNLLSHAISFHIIYVGSDPVIDNFIKYKRIFGEKLGVNVVIHYFKENITQNILEEKIKGIEIQADAMIIQLPLPEHLDTQSILDCVPIAKDVDVLGTSALKKFSTQESLLFPPVTGSIVQIFKRYNIQLEGKKILLVGNGSLVGYPMSLWLQKNNYTYDVITVETDDSIKEQLLKKADVIISGAGVPSLITCDMVKEGVVLIDAGTSEAGKRVVGDIHPDTREKASLITPVPGGIGPITIAVLYQNIITAYKKYHDK